MGMIGSILGALFGTGRNVVAETVEVFRPNAEAAEVREAAQAAAALSQFAAEFAGPRRSPFDVLIDGINRLPRPMLALGTIGLLVSALVDPIWFAARMQGIALVPEPLWWLMGAIVSFYFGARHQYKAQTYEASMGRSLELAPKVVAGIEALRRLQTEDEPTTAPTIAPATPPISDSTTDILPNAAIEEWRRSRGQ
jgi:hypothetical protein